VNEPDIEDGCTRHFGLIGAQSRRGVEVDLVVFLNGLPIAVIELKEPADPQADLTAAIKQLDRYQDNVALPPWVKGLGGAAAEGPARQLLTAVGLGERAASGPRELSGDELQRVAIARALVHALRLVLADPGPGHRAIRTVGGPHSGLRGTVLP
jgi:hypothetical protein